MTVMIAMAWVGAMLALGMLLRAKIPVMRKMLIPSCVTGGVIGCILMNTGLITNASADLYTTIVSQLFIISFISIGLTGTDQPESSAGSKDNVSKTIIKGSLGMGLVWCMFYCMQAVIGALGVSIAGKSVGMAPIYGMLLPFAFAQGPGQAATFGKVYESYGWTDASVVGVTFASIGFLFAFLLGVPLAKYGLKKGLAKHCSECNTISYSVGRGYFQPEEQQKSMGKVTCFHGNIDTLSFHFALVGIAYLMARGVQAILLMVLPQGAHSTVTGLFFLIGMVMGYVLKWILKRTQVAIIHDNETQKRITGWTSDYLIVCAFMAVQLSVISKWIIPILFASLLCGIFTFVCCLYFGQRFGGENDFERTLGLWGMSTGTVPSGVALVRIVDPDLKTTTAVELGGMNLASKINLIILPINFAISAGAIAFATGQIYMLLIAAGLLVLLKLFRVWGKRSYVLRGEETEV